MTRLRHYRLAAKLKLREVAARIGLQPGTVHDAEVRGILTPRLAVKYAAAFPGITWQDLLEPPKEMATTSDLSDRSDRSDNKTKEE